jgi:hypothetical protein
MTPLPQVTAPTKFGFLRMLAAGPTITRDRLAAFAEKVRPC